jgi:hypothetical protein
MIHFNCCSFIRIVLDHTYLLCYCCRKSSTCHERWSTLFSFCCCCCCSRSTSARCFTFTYAIVISKWFNCKLYCRTYELLSGKYTSCVYSILTINRQTTRLLLLFVCLFFRLSMSRLRFWRRVLAHCIPIYRNIFFIHMTIGLHCLKMNVQKISHLDNSSIHCNSVMMLFKWISS